MSRVRIFSRYFPKGHPKAGKPTFFVEKIYACIGVRGDFLDIDIPQVDNFLYNYDEDFFDRKIHTIRAGKHFKVGDSFSPRVWSGKPYQSKQITFAPEITVERVFDFKILIDKDYISVLIDDFIFYEQNSQFVTQPEALETLANNDGLEINDFKSWFNWGKMPFDGQLISWNKEISY